VQSRPNAVFRVNQTHSNFPLSQIATSMMPIPIHSSKLRVASFGIFFRPFAGHFDHTRSATQVAD
jgi:hypothetical protein